MHVIRMVECKHPVFQSCEPALLRHIVGYLRQYYYDEHMYVVKQGEITNAMYLVHTGQVQEISENYDDDEDEGVNRIVYKEGELFGAAQGLVRDKPFDYSYRTTIKSRILTLVLDDWEYLLKHFPDSKKLIDNYQRTTRGDDDDKPGPPPPLVPDSSTTLGTPGGSETSMDYRWGLPDEPSGGPPVIPPPNTNSKPEVATSRADPIHEMKRNSYSKAPRVYNSDEHSLVDDHEETSRVKREPKAVKLKDDIKSTLPLTLTDGMGEKRKSSLRIADKSLKSAASVKFHIGEPLTASSSTQLFERIRNAAKDVDNKLASRNKKVNNDAPSQKVTASTPHHSIEEYLAYKYKMRESYAYHPKRDDDDATDTDIRMNPSYRQTRVEYTTADYDGSGREHFTHSQLAESKNRINSIHNLNAPVLNLERPFGDNKFGESSSSTEEERVDSQVPMTSKQYKQQSNAVEPKSNDYTDQFNDQAIADSDNKPVDRSDVTPMARTPAATELLALPAPSAIIEQEQSVFSPEFQNTVKPETHTAPINMLPTVPTDPMLALPSSEPPQLEPVEDTLPETQTPTETANTATLEDQLKDFLRGVLLDIFAALQPAEHAVPKIQTPTGAITSIETPSGEESQGTDSEGVKTYTDMSKPGQVQLDEEKTDQAKAIDKERKEKKD